MAASPAFAAAAAEDDAGTTEIPLRLEERLERVNLAALEMTSRKRTRAVDLLADETVVVTEETVVIVTEPATVRR